MSNTDYSNMMTKGVASSLESIPVENGKVRFTTDTDQLFIDMDGERHELSDIIRGYKESEIKSLLAPLPKLYLSSDTHKFFVYASGEWIVVGKNEWIGTKAEFETAVTSGEIVEGMTVYITDDYTGDGADLSLYATKEYTNNTFIPKTDVVDNVTSTDTDKPLSAKQGKELNDKWDDIRKSFYIGPGESITLLCRDKEVLGNLIILSSFHVIPSYKSIVMVMTGNGNNTNSGQRVTITEILASSIVTYDRLDVSGSYNEVLITNNSDEYGVYIRAVTLFGQSPILLTD